MVSSAGDSVREVREAVRGLGLWGAFPWAFATSVVCAFGVALSGWVRAPFVGWIVSGVGWVLLGFLGLGGVVSRPWWRALGGVAVGEVAAAAVVATHVLGLSALASPGFGLEEGGAALAGFVATAAAGLWGWMRWGSSPLGSLGAAAWAAALAWAPLGLAAVVAYATARPGGPG